MSIVCWEAIPDDVIEALVNVLTWPLQRESHWKVCVISAVRDESPDDFHQTVYAFFNLFLTSKQFNRVSKRLNIDWIKLATDGPFSHYQLYGIRREEEPDLQTKEMCRSFTHYESALPVMRYEIDIFIKKHKVIYRTKASGKIYKGYVGVRKLKQIKLQPQALDKEFKTLLKRHESINKKRNALANRLRSINEQLSAKQKLKAIKTEAATLFSFLQK